MGKQKNLPGNPMKIRHEQTRPSGEIVYALLPVQRVFLLSNSSVSNILFPGPSISGPALIIGVSNDLSGLHNFISPIRSRNNISSGSFFTFPIQLHSSQARKRPFLSGIYHLIHQSHFCTWSLLPPCVPEKAILSR